MKVVLDLDDAIIGHLVAEYSTRPAPDADAPFEEYLTHLVATAAAARAGDAVQPLPDADTPGGFVRQARLNSGWSLKNLADVLDVDQSHLSRIEHGHRPINPDLAAHFADVVGLDDVARARLEELSDRDSNRRPGRIHPPGEQPNALTLHEPAYLFFRDEAGLTDKQIAQSAGIDLETLAYALQRRVLLDRATAQALCDALGATRIGAIFPSQAGFLPPPRRRKPDDLIG